MRGRSAIPRWLEPGAPPDSFPDPRHALRNPDGLLAVGGDLSSARLLAAYQRGIFPWYEAGQPILWWSPDPRAVLFPAQLKISRSLRKSLRRAELQCSVDRDFAGVIRECAAPRGDGQGTWITGKMVAAYQRLHELGYAHSAETWLEGRLVGGLYGVAMGRMFFGESMFSHRSDASKIALVRLAEFLQTSGFGLIDCQMPSPHLRSLGSCDLPRQRFLALLERYSRLTEPPVQWHAGASLPLPAAIVSAH